MVYGSNWDILVFDAVCHTRPHHAFVVSGVCDIEAGSTLGEHGSQVSVLGVWVWVCLWVGGFLHWWPACVRGVVDWGD